MSFRKLAIAIVLCSSPVVLGAQQTGATKPASVDCAKVNAPVDHGAMDHTAHQAAMADCAGAVPTMPGQAAFGAISEVVRMLKADPATDWSRV